MNLILYLVLAAYLKSFEFTAGEVRSAIRNVKPGKAAGPSGVTVEMIVAVDMEGVLWVTDLCNAIVREGKIPDDWKHSWLVTVYKGKGDALECGSYINPRLSVDHTGIKLLDQ